MDMSLLYECKQGEKEKVGPIRLKENVAEKTLRKRDAKDPSGSK